LLTYYFNPIFYEFVNVDALEALFDALEALNYILICFIQ